MREALELGPGAGDHGIDFHDAATRVRREGRTRGQVHQIGARPRLHQAGKDAVVLERIHRVVGSEVAVVALVVRAADVHLVLGVGGRDNALEVQGTRDGSGEHGVADRAHGGSPGQNDLGRSAASRHGDGALRRLLAGSTNFGGRGAVCIGTGVVQQLGAGSGGRAGERIERVAHAPIHRLAGQRDDGIEHGRVGNAAARALRGRGSGGRSGGQGTSRVAVRARVGAPEKVEAVVDALGLDQGELGGQGQRIGGALRLQDCLVGDALLDRNGLVRGARHDAGDGELTATLAFLSSTEAARRNARGSLHDAPGDGGSGEALAARNEAVGILGVGHREHRDVPQVNAGDGKACDRLIGVLDVDGSRVSLSDRVECVLGIGHYLSPIVVVQRPREARSELAISSRATCSGGSAAIRCTSSSTVFSTSAFSMGSLTTTVPAM